MSYTTHYLSKLFNKSHQTIKNWAGEFHMYLSSTANPPKGRQRIFTPDDLKVFALVSEMKGAGGLFTGIHNALAAGQRGEIPDKPLNQPAKTDDSSLLILRQQMFEMEKQLVGGDAQIALLKEMLAEAQRRIIELERENARLSLSDN